MTNLWEPDRDVLARKTAVRGQTTLSAHAYGVNALGQRTGRDLTGTLRAEFYGGPAETVFPTSWGYDLLGQVTAETKILDPDAGRSFTYDQIGNRLTSTEGSATTAYFRDAAATLPGANALNQYVAIPAHPAAPAHDEDGNQTAGAIRPLGAAAIAACAFTWDAENRLVSSTPAGTTTTTRHTYDAFGRRTATLTFGGGSGTASAATLFIHDGWNLVAEYVLESGAWALDRTYAWGPDLSGSLQGAGGVGGLLAVSLKRSAPGWYYPLYDGNGNIEAYLTSAGDFAAIYQYDAFGNVLSRPGSGAASVAAQQLFHHRFSTKYQDASTGFYYYGFRYYSPVSGRWLSRDPIGERGGINLYGIGMNAGANMLDVLGLLKLVGDPTYRWIGVVLESWSNSKTLVAVEMRARVTDCTSGRSDSYVSSLVHAGSLPAIRMVDVNDGTIDTNGYLPLLNPGTATKTPVARDGTCGRASFRVTVVQDSQPGDWNRPPPDNSLITAAELGDKGWSFVPGVITSEGRARIGTNYTGVSFVLKWKFCGRSTDWSIVGSQLIRGSPHPMGGPGLQRIGKGFPFAGEPGKTEDGTASIWGKPEAFRRVDTSNLPLADPSNL